MNVSQHTLKGGGLDFLSPVRLSTMENEPWFKCKFERQTPRAAERLVLFFIGRSQHRHRYKITWRAKLKRKKNHEWNRTEATGDVFSWASREIKFLSCFCRGCGLIYDEFDCATFLLYLGRWLADQTSVWWLSFCVCLNSFKSSKTRTDKLALYGNESQSHERG